MVVIFLEDHIDSFSSGRLELGKVNKQEKVLKITSNHKGIPYEFIFETAK